MRVNILAFFPNLWGISVQPVSVKYVRFNLMSELEEVLLLHQSIEKGFVFLSVYFKREGRDRERERERESQAAT